MPVAFCWPRHMWLCMLRHIPIVTLIRDSRSTTNGLVLISLMYCMPHVKASVIGEQAFADILDPSEVAWPAGGVSTPSSGLGLRIVKELDT